MKTSDFDYDLPPEYIAQTPAEPRDSSRLMVLHRATGQIEHAIFRDIGRYLRPGDLLVLNQTRVIPARLFARKPTGGRVEILLLRKRDDLTWEALVGGKGLSAGKKLILESDDSNQFVQDLDDSRQFIQESDHSSRFTQESDDSSRRRLTEYPKSGDFGFRTGISKSGDFDSKRFIQDSEDSGQFIQESDDSSRFTQESDHSSRFIQESDDSSRRRFTEYPKSGDFGFRTGISKSGDFDSKQFIQDSEDSGQFIQESDDSSRFTQESDDSSRRRLTEYPKSGDFGFRTGISKSGDFDSKQFIQDSEDSGQFIQESDDSSRFTQESDHSSRFTQESDDSSRRRLTEYPKSGDFGFQTGISKSGDFGFQTGIHKSGDFGFQTGVPGSGGFGFQTGIQKSGNFSFKTETPDLRATPPNLQAEIIEVLEGSRRLIRFSEPIEPYFPKVGHVPLPPYIHTPLADPERYQTVYAREPGSAAAPTAGLHFTPRLLDELQAQGVRLGWVTLHVGLDTFAPVTEDDPSQHKMHTEWCHLPPETADLINQTRAQGGRVIAVGTTSVRTLESAASLNTEHRTPNTEPRPPLTAFTGLTSLYILPGYQFKVVDAMITNFHLPRSTLIMLVSAFAGRETILHAYEVAKQEGYRFYSFGDAMLIL